MANPRIYMMSNKLQKSRTLTLIEEFKDNLKNICGKYMDVGCGPGHVTNDVILPNLDANAQMIGTDISENMIKYANETFKDKKRLQFETLDIQTKDLPQKYNSEFDHIFSFYTLQWCNDIRQAFKNIHQMLRPNGTMLLSIAASQDFYEVLKIMVRDIRFAQYIPNAMKNIAPYQESKNARKELKELLQCIGFTVHHCSLREMSHSEKKLEHFLNSIISVLEFHEDMPQDLREEFTNELKEEYMKRKIVYRSFYDNQELTLDLHKILIVHAQKI